jgi:WD40 repeat protein
VPSLIRQAARLAGVRFGADAYTGDRGDLRESLVRALEALRDAKGSAIVVLDGLDELDEADRDLAFLPVALPDRVRLVVTCRPDLPLLGALRARVPAAEEIAIPPLSPGDLATLAEKRLGGALPVPLDVLLDRTGGSPLLATRAIAVIERAIAAGEAPRPEALPATVSEVADGIYREIAEKTGSNPQSAAGRERARLLQILAVAREPLAIADLADLAPLPLETARDRVAEASRFLLDRGGRFEPWHRALADHVRAEVLGDAGARAIEEEILAWIARTPGSAYALRHRVAHLLALGRASDAAAILLDPREIDARASAGLVFDLIAEIDDVARALPSDADPRALLDAISRAVRLHAHFLARHPSALFQILAGALPPDLPGAAAYLAAFRAHRRSVDPRFPWLRTVRAGAPGDRASLLSVLRGHEGEVFAIAASPRGDRLVSAAADGTLRLWDARTGGAIRAIRVSAKRAVAVAFSPDGLSLACGTDEGEIHLHDARDGAEIAVHRAHDGPVWALAFSPDGRTLASGGRDRTVRTSTRDGEPRLRLDVDGVVTGVAFSPDRSRLAATLTSARVALFAASGELLATFPDLEDAAWSVAFSPDGSRLAVASADGTARLLDARTLAPLAELRLPDERLYACAFSPDGALVACAGTGRRVYLWSPASPNDAPAALPALGGAIDAIAFSPEGNAVFAASTDGAVRVFSTSAALTAPAPREGAVAGAAVFSHRGRHLAVGFHDGRVELWSAATGHVERTFAAHTRFVTAVAFSPDDRLLASASRDGTAAVHRADGRVLARLAGHEGPVNAVAFTPDGARVITGGSDHTARLFTLLGARQTHRFDHSDAVTSLAVSRDGRLLAAGARGGEVRVWDIATGVTVACFTAGASLALRFSTSAELLLVTAHSREETAWSLETASRVPLTRDAATAEFTLRAATNADESELRRARDGRAVTHYPAALPNLVANQDGRSLLAWGGSSVHLIVVEEG